MAGSVCDADQDHETSGLIPGRYFKISGKLRFSQAALILILTMLLAACNDNSNTAASNSPLAAATSTTQPTSTISATATVPTLAPTTAATKGATGSAALGVPFQLKLNQPQQIAAENLTVEFVKVIADSRCPRNVACITAGSVTVQISLQKSGQTYNTELTLPGLTQNKQLQSIAGYKIELQDVSPYPSAPGGVVSGSGTPTGNPSESSVTLLISKV